MKHAKARAALACGLLLLFLNSCWVPYFSPEISYGLLFSQKFGSPVQQFSGSLSNSDYLSSSSAGQSIYVPINPKNYELGGALITIVGNSYNVMALKFTDGTWDNLHTWKNVIDRPEVEEAEQFVFGPGPTLYLRGAGTTAVLLDFYTYAAATVLGPTVHEVGNETYTRTYLGTHPKKEYKESVLLAMYIDDKGENFVFAELGGQNAKWLPATFTTFSEPAAFDFGGNGAPDIGTFFSRNPEGEVNTWGVSGLWDGVPYSYLQYLDEEGDPAFRTAESYNRLITARFTSGYSYSLSRQTLTVYRGSIDLRLFTLYTGNLRLIGERYVDTDVRYAVFTRTAFNNETGQLSVEVYEHLISDLEAIAD